MSTDLEDFCAKVGMYWIGAGFGAYNYDQGGLSQLIIFLCLVTGFMMLERVVRSRW